MATTMEANLNWEGGLRFTGSGPSGRTVTFDAGPEHAGPSPMETVLLALGGCSAIDVVALLEKMREPLGGLAVALAAERAGDHPRVFVRATLHFTVRGRGLDPEKVRRAVELSRDKYCSVGAMVGKTAELTYTWEIVEDQ